MKDVFIFCDDIDMIPGKLRLKKGGGHGGHNGIKSIAQHAGTDFWSCKIGVGRPGHSRQNVSSYVLSQFNADDHNWMDTLFQEICYHAPELLHTEPNIFSSKVMQNRKNVS